MISRNKIFFGSIILAILFIGSSFSAQAQETGLLKISPAVVELQMNVNQNYNQDVIIKNITDQEKIVFIEITDIVAIDNNGNITFSEKGSMVSDWVSIEEKEFKLAPQEERKVEINLDVPLDTYFGKYLFFISFSDNEMFLSSTSYTGTTFIVDLIGDKKEQLEITNFITDKSTYNSLPIDINIDLKNKGNTLLRPTGLITITNLRGDEFASYRINKKNNLLYPGDSTHFTQKVKDLKLSIGRYQVIASFIFGDSKETIIDTSTFWIIPLDNIITLLFIFILLLILLYIIFIYYLKSKDSTIQLSNNKTVIQLNYKYRKLLFVSLGLIVLIMILLYLLQLFF